MSHSNSSIFLAVCSLLQIFIAGSHTFAAQESYRLSSSFPSSLQITGERGLEFTNTIRDLSNNEIEIIFHEPGELTSGLDAIPATANGTVDMAWSSPGYYMSVDTAFSLFTHVPFSSSPREYLVWLYEAGGIDLQDQIARSHNLKIIPCVSQAAETSLLMREPLDKVEDLRGKKLRIFGITSKVFEALGANVVLMPGGELQTAYSEGIIDGMEFSTPSINSLFLEYADAYHYFPGWHAPFTIGSLFINLQVWNSMSERTKQLLSVTCKNQVLTSLTQSEILQANALMSLVNTKKERVKYWPPSFLGKFLETWIEISNNEARANPNYKKVWNSYKTFKKTYSHWGSKGYIEHRRSPMMIDIERAMMESASD